MDFLGSMRVGGTVVFDVTHNGERKEKMEREKVKGGGKYFIKRNGYVLDFVRWSTSWR
jgi:hypothetical protein